MIFARRALQRRLNELRKALGDETVDKLVPRLNRPGRDRLAAMWEVTILHALSRRGALRNEEPLPSGRRPDISFEAAALRLTADVTVVSDEGLDDANPYAELSQLIEEAKTMLGLSVGGVDIRIKSTRYRSGRGIRSALRLPERKRLRAFVKDQIVPTLRSQIASGAKVLHVSIDDDEIGLDVTIDPKGSPYRQIGFATYNVPGIKDRNPLYNALKAKADQLRGADGVTGVIVCDGNCGALADRRTSAGEVSASEIASEFLRQYSSVEFVLLLTVRDEPIHPWLRASGSSFRAHTILVVRKGCEVEEQLKSLFMAMIAEMPKPVLTPANGARRAREASYETGYHGGYAVAGNKIRIGSRELLEVLAGLHSGDRNNRKTDAASDQNKSNPAQFAFLRNLQQGYLPTAIEIIKTDENEGDDWVEFDFGETDPAISPFS